MFKRLAAVAGLLMAVPFVARAGTILPPRTGQGSCYSAEGVVIPCAGTGQDGEWQAGIAWPSSRFTDNRDGTVTDGLTGLIWLKDANCTEAAGGIDRAGGLLDWPSALAWCNGLAGGKCGLSDNSAAGDWRLPNINELRSLVDYSRHDPALPAGHPFMNVRSAWYWSSTTNPAYTGGAYNVGMSRGSIHVTGKARAVNVRPAIGSESRVENKADTALGVWPVRSGQSVTAPRR
jgi:hypothetical protein